VRLPDSLVRGEAELLLRASTGGRLCTPQVRKSHPHAVRHPAPKIVPDCRIWRPKLSILLRLWGRADGPDYFDFQEFSPRPISLGAPPPEKLAAETADESRLYSDDSTSMGQGLPAFRAGVRFSFRMLARPTLLCNGFRRSNPELEHTFPTKSRFNLTIPHSDDGGTGS